MNIEQQIQQLSQMTGVSVADVRCMCQGIVNSMAEDGFKSEHLEQSESEQAEIVGAYMQNQVRKTDTFVTAYLTRGRKALAEFVLADLRGAA